MEDPIIDQNPAPEDVVTTFKKPLDQRTLIAIGAVGGIILLVGVSLLLKDTDDMPQTVIDTTAPVTDQVVESDTTGYNRINAGSATPDGFPTELLLEPDNYITEGYTLEYLDTGESQLTMRYTSEKTSAENFAGYRDILKNDNWVFINQYESDSVSVLYGLKHEDEINVTLQTLSSTSTEVIISYFKGQGQLNSAN